jgi:hypothetical protein
MSHPYQNHITVIIGNPDEKFQTKVSEKAFEECRTEKDVWIDYVFRTFEIGSLQLEPKYKSPIDTIFSTMLEDEVRLAKPFHGITDNGGKELPVIMFFEDYVQDLSGNPIPIWRFTDEMLTQIAEYFKKVIKADWIHISSTLAI